MTTKRSEQLLEMALRAYELQLPEVGPHRARQIETMALEAAARAELQELKQEGGTPQKEGT